MKIKNLQVNHYILIAILILAAVLRLNHINQPLIDLFSWRQASTAMMAENFYKTNWNIFYPEVNWSGPVPSYQGREFQTVSYITAILYNLFGQQDWVGRCVAVTFGLWGIFALYQLVCRVWDEKHALVSAAIMAILPGSIFVERSFLPDPAMVSLVTTSLWLLVVYFQTERLRYLLLACVIGTWGFLSKIPGLIVGIPMLYAMFTILGEKQQLQPKKLKIIAIAAVLVLTPVIVYYLWARHLALTYPPHHFAGSHNWLWDQGLQKWLGEMYFLPRLWGHLKNGLWTTPIIILVLLGLIVPPPTKKESSQSTSEQILENKEVKAPWLFHWWMIGCVFYYIIGAHQILENSWNLHLVNPAAAALASHGLITIASLINRFAASQEKLSLVIIVVLLLIIGSQGQSVLKYMYKPSPPWDATPDYELGLALRQVSKKDDLVVAITNTMGNPVAIYYSQRRGWVFPQNEPGQWIKELPKDDNETIRLFEELRTNGADWLGFTEPQAQQIWKNHPLFVQHIKKTCEFNSKTDQWLIYRILSPLIP